MNLEKQVVSLEFSKKLKELGFKQDSLFYWFYNRRFNDFLASDTNLWKPSEEDMLCSAYTVADLEWILPKKICIDRDEFKLIINKFRENGDKWNIQYVNSEGMIIGKISKDERLVIVMAMKIIELIEDKLLIIE